MQIETERLVLRRWEEGDAKDLLLYARDCRIGPIAGWEPHKNIEDSLFVIRTVFAAPEVYAVVLKENGKAVGSIGLMSDGDGTLKMAADERELGYWIGVPYWGQGLIPEAAEALLRHAFVDLGCNAVWRGYYEGNRQSERVGAKCGFQPHHYVEHARTPLGDYRREYFTLLTREDWAKRQLQPAVEP